MSSKEVLRSGGEDASNKIGYGFDVHLWVGVLGLYFEIVYLYCVFRAFHDWIYLRGCVPCVAEVHPESTRALENPLTYGAYKSAGFRRKKRICR